MAKKIERRSVSMPVELRKDGDGKTGRTIEGYAAVFDSDSQDMGFIERIDKKAFDGVIERSDVVALYNHSELPGVLARSVNGEGTLKLKVDDKGLKMSFEAPNTQLGNDMVESVGRGDIRGMSFAFTVETDEWTHDADNDTYRRVIKQIEQLYDVSLVLNPAYTATSVETKGLEQLKEIEKRNAGKESEEDGHKGDGNEDGAAAEQRHTQQKTERKDGRDEDKREHAPNDIYYRTLREGIYG